MNSDESQKSAATEAGAWFGPGRFALMLAALILASFLEVLTGYGTFFFRDFSLFGYPLASYLRESFWLGEIPLWNPLSNCGLPFLAQWNTLSLYPLSLIYLLFPLSWALSVFCILHSFLAGMGMYFLAHRWTGNRLASAIAGVVFAFSGLSQCALMWPNNIAALGWMPWVVLMVETASIQGGIRRIALAALVGAMQMLTGAPEIIFFTWCAMGTLWLAQLADGTVRQREFLGRIVCVLLLVTGLAAAQLLPFLDLLAHSQRDVSFGDSGWAMPGTGLANYLVPLFRTQPSHVGFYSQLDQYWISSYYLGAATIGLALLAFWKARSKQVWILVSLSALSILMAMGESGFIMSAVRHVIPQLGYMRYPIKFVVLGTFLIPLLAAYGMAWFQELPNERWKAERKKIGGLALGLIGVMGGIAWFAWKYPVIEKFPSFIFDVHATVLNALVRSLFLMAIIGCLMLQRRILTPKLQRLLQVFLVLLVWLDLHTHAPGLAPTVQRSLYDLDTIRQYLNWDKQAKAGESRAMLTAFAMESIRNRFMSKPADQINVDRLALYANCNLLDHAAKVNGFFSLYLRETDRLCNEFYMPTNTLEPLKDFLGVSMISHPTNALQWVARDTFMPMITAGQQAVFADDSTALKEILSSSFDPRSMVYLPLEGRGVIRATNAAQATVHPRRFSAHRIEAQIEASAPAIVVVAQSFYHPWHAYVDGKPVRLWRANHAFQALDIPAGSHQMSLAYEDHVFLAGGIISLLTLAGCLAVCLRRRPT